MTSSWEATPEPKTDLSVDEGVVSVEKWLQKHGVSYSALRALPLSVIDEKRSRQNQARATPIVQDSVDRFVKSLKEGAQLPPVVGYKSGNRVVLIDGNNRDAACRKFYGPSGNIRTFIVHPDTTSETILAMTVDANSNHGVTPDLSWRVTQAVHLNACGYALEKACSFANVTSRQVTDYQRMVRAEQRAKALKIQGFSTLSSNSKLKLMAIPSDPVFMQACLVAVETEMTYEEVNAFVRETKAQSEEALQIQLIGKVADERKMEKKAREALGKPKQMKSAKLGLITGLGKIQHADVGAIARQIITDEEREEIITRCYAASEHMFAIITALEVSKDVRDAV